MVTSEFLGDVHVIESNLIIFVTEKAKQSKDLWPIDVHL